MKYIYAIRTVDIVAPHDLSVLDHEEYGWVTLIKCKEYDETLDKYEQRLVARAVLISVEMETDNEESRYGTSFAILNKYDDYLISILKSLSYYY